MVLDIEFDKAANVHKVISLEFTASTVRLMQFEYAGSGFRARAFAEIDMPQEAVNAEGEITDPVAIGRLIQSGLAKTQPKLVDTPYVACVLPQNLLFFITLKLPKMEKEELKGVVSNKVGSVLPMPESEVYWDWHRIESEDEEERIQLVAMSRKVVDSYMKALAVAGLVPLLFEPSALAASRVLADTLQNSTQSAVMVELKQNDYILSLLHKGEIIFSSEITLDGEKESNSTKTRLLANKIREMSKFSLLPTPIKEADLHVVFYGDVDEVNELVSELKLQLKAKISRFSYKSDSFQLLEFITHKRVDSYIPLIGTAIRGLPNFEGGETLNLVPLSAQQAFSRKELTRMLKRYLLFLVVDLGLLALLFILVSQQMQQRVNNLAGQYEAILTVADSEKVRETEQVIHKLNTTTTNVLAMSQDIYDWQQLLALVSNSTSSEITLTSLDVTQVLERGNSGDYWDVVIAGEGETREAVLEMLEELRNSTLLEDVKLPLQSLASENNLVFAIEAKLPFKNLLTTDDKAK